jgi:hypothetical protein
MPIRDDIRRRYAPYWTLTELPAPSGDPAGALPQAFACGACGHDDVEPVGEGHFGSLAGGENWYEVRCRACGTVTEYRHEWG